MDLKTLLAQNLSDVKVEYNGHVVLVTYDASNFTPELEAKVRAASEGEADEVAAMLCALVHDWDLEETEGVPLEVEAEAMMKLPIKFLLAMMLTITKDMVGDPLPDATSDAS